MADKFNWDDYEDDAPPETESAGGTNWVGPAAGIAGVAGAAGLGAYGIRRMLRSPRAQAMGQQVGREVLRDRGPVGAVGRVLTAGPKATNTTDPRITEAKASKMEHDARASAARADAAEERLRAMRQPAKPAPVRTKSVTTKPAPSRTTPSKPAPPAEKPEPRTGPRTAPKVKGQPRGASTPELLRRQQAMVEARRNVAGDEAADLLAERLGIGARTTAMEGGHPRVARLPKVAGGAASLLMMLMDAQSMPEQMRDADQAAEQFRRAKWQRQFPGIPYPEPTQGI